MTRKSKINKLSIVILSGLISVSTLSVNPNIYAKELEIIEVLPNNKDVNIKIIEKNNSTAVIEVTAQKEVKNVILKLAVDSSKTIEKKLGALKKGQVIKFEHSLDVNTAEKILPKTSLVNKEENFKVRLNNHSISGSLSYSVEETLQTSNTKNTSSENTNSNENKENKDTIPVNNQDSNKNTEVTQEKPQDKKEENKKDQVVVFEDENLKTVLLNLFKNNTSYDGLGDTIEGEYEFKLKDPEYKISQDATELTVADLEQLDAIALRGFTLDEDFNPIFYEFKSIKGLEYATNLKQLTINSGMIPENNPENEELQKDFAAGIEYSKGSFSDLSPLKNLKNLELLRLSHNNIEDVTSLKELTNLKELYLSHNKIKDVAILSELKSLEKFDVSKNEITNLSVVSNYNNLKLLDLVRNNISSLESIKNLVNLEYLNADNNKITNIDLSKLTNLTDLHLSKNKLSDLLSLNTSNLKTLDISSNKLEDASLNIEKIKENTNITNLNISNNLISDINFVSNLVNLEQLFADDNKLQDIRAISNLTKLQWLYLNNNKIENIDSIRNLTNLVRLRIENNEVSNISSLENITSLSEAHLAGNKIKDLTPLDNLKELYDKTTENQRVEEEFKIAKEYEEFYKKAIGLKKGTLEFENHILTKEDMLKIKEITKTSGDVTDEFLAPLKYAENLEIFTVALNDGKRLASNLDVITSKPKLKKFSYISNTEEKEKIDLKLNNFASPNLEDFRVTSTNISDLSFLANNNLKVLVIDESNLISLDQIINMTNLERLEVSNNNIEKLANLSNLTNLNTLYLKGNPIKDISSLENNQNLVALIIDKTQISDISTLEKLKNLQRLHIDGNNLADNYMEVIKKIATANTLGLGDINISDFEWLKSFAIRDEVVTTNSTNIEDAGENDARSISFKNLNINAEVSKNDIVEGKVILANPLKDWDNVPVIQDKNSDKKNPNLTFVDDKIEVTLSSENNTQNFSYPIYIENYNYSFGEYQIPPLITGNVNLNINIVDNTSSDISEFSSMQKKVRSIGGKFFASIKGQNIDTSKISFEIFKNEEKVANINYELASSNKESADYIFDLPANNSATSDNTYTIKLIIDGKDSSLPALKINQEANINLVNHEYGLNASGVYFNEDRTKIEVEFSEEILNALENIEQLKDFITISRGKSNEYVDYTNLYDTESISLENNSLIINLASPVKEEDTSLYKVKINKAALKNLNDKYNDEINLFVESYKSKTQARISDYIIHNPVLSAAGGEVSIDIFGKNLDPNKGTKIKILDSDKIDENKELTDSIIYTGGQDKLNAKFTLPINITKNTKSYKLIFMHNDKEVFYRYLGENSNKGDRPVVSVLSSENIDNYPSLSNLAISSYATSSKGDITEEINTSHTTTAKNQNSKKTAVRVYGANLSEDLTKVKIIDQNGVEWPIRTANTFQSSSMPLMVLPGINNKGNGIIGNGTFQFVEVILPSDIAKTMTYTYYFAVDGKNFDTEKTVSATVEKTSGNLEPNKKVIRVKYQDQNGNKLKDDKEIIGYPWFEYNIEKEAIENYSYKSVKNNEELVGTFGELDKEIVLIYEEKASIDNTALENAKSKLKEAIDFKISSLEDFNLADSNISLDYYSVRKNARQVYELNTASLEEINQAIADLENKKSQVELNIYKNKAIIKLDEYQNLSNKEEVKNKILEAVDKTAVDKILGELSTKPSDEEMTISDFITSTANIDKNTEIFTTIVKGQNLDPNRITFNFKKDNQKIANLEYSVEKLADASLKYSFIVGKNLTNSEIKYSVSIKLDNKLQMLSAVKVNQMS